MLATVEADPNERAQVIQLVGVFGGQIVDVGTTQVTVMLAGPPAVARRLRGADPPLRDRRAPADRADRAA